MYGNRKIIHFLVHRANDRSPLEVSVYENNLSTKQDQPEIHY